MKALGSPARPTSSSNATSERHRLPRSWQKVITGVVALIVAFGAMTAWLLVWPAQGMPTRVSAIVLLAGHGYRMPVALRLASEHLAAVLVVSQGSPRVRKSVSATATRGKDHLLRPEPR